MKHDNPYFEKVWLEISSDAELYSYLLDKFSDRLEAEAYQVLVENAKEPLIHGKLSS